jgi:FkbM family methyltransferase
LLSIARRALSAVRDGRIIYGLKRRWSVTRRFYLRHCKGVIHVGANEGSERTEYAKRGLNVLWIEPLPDVFATLQANIRDLPGQEAVCALVTDRDGDQHRLHVSDHHGLCSSILAPQDINDVLPDFKFTGDIDLESITLASLMRTRDVSRFDALVIDTQGAELRVLKGAESILSVFQYIECEGADFDFYRGYPRPEAIRELLSRHGFRQIREDTFRKSQYGREFDMLFRRS